MYGEEKRKGGQTLRVIIDNYQKIWKKVNSFISLSSIIGEPTGSNLVKNVVSLTQVEYDNAKNTGALIPTTFYIIIL